MKRNITVNMFGTLYPMDEDAYELLKRYTDNMRAYFHNQEGGDEIADDIEARIAELMNEMLATGAKAVGIASMERMPILQMMIMVTEWFAINNKDRCM